MLTAKSHQLALRLVLQFALVIFLAACQIKGQVSLDGQPLAGQIVTLTGEGLNLTTETDQRGNYRFNDLAGGFYEVSIQAQGSTTHRVEKVSKQISVTGLDFAISTRTRRITTEGTLTGTVDSNGTLVWKGIPYASAPINDLRWKAARPAESRSGDYLSLAFPPPCPQLAHLQINVPLSQIGDVVGKEDCLYLNIWTPDFATLPQGEERRPVMFWIHGGGNTAGESAIFDGKVLAEKYGVIVVTTNYRLGALGYFSHPALRDNASARLDTTANFALTDLIQALQWLQTNIRAFGGDPERVMIFGESAGAANVGALLASPEAAGLFHRAAMQSGGFGWATRNQAENHVSEGGNPASARELISKLLVADGSAQTLTEAHQLQASMSPSELRTYLLGKSPQQLLADFDGSRFGMYPYPTLIRDGIVLPDSEPYAVFRSGLYNQVPIMTGTNRDESKIFMAFNPEFVPGGLPLLIKDPDYFNLAAHYQSTLWRARAVDEFASATAGQNHPVYAYRFDWDEAPKILWNDLAILIGASHFFEIPFVFNTPDTFTVKIGSPLLFTKAEAEGRQILADSMSSYWAAFAYDGDPGQGVNNTEPATWTPWTQNGDADNIILFDSMNDQGIRMTNSQVSIAGVREALQQEQGFPSSDKQCAWYQMLFGTDAWYDGQCAL